MEYLAKKCSLGLFNRVNPGKIHISNFQTTKLYQNIYNILTVIIVCVKRREEFLRKETHDKPSTQAQGQWKNAGLTEPPKAQFLP